MRSLIYLMVLMLAAMLGLAACGGGGTGHDGATSSSTTGGSVTNTVGSENSGPRVTAIFPSDTFAASGVEGTEGQGNLHVQFDYTGTEQFWLYTEEKNGLIVSGNGGFNGNQFSAQVRLRGDINAGEYETNVLFHICLDQGCSKGELPGSPFVHALKYTVSPNISVQSTINLQREGQQPAKTVFIPVTIPPEAGQVQATVITSQPYAFEIMLQGAQLQIKTQQIRAGTYDADVQLTSLTDPRYAKHVSVHYQVDPPESGEVDLAATPRYVSLAANQGKTVSQKIKFTRPSWTPDWTPPHFIDAPSFFSLKDLGNDEYEVIVNTAGAESRSYTGYLLADAGPIAGYVVTTISVDVSQPFYGTGFSTRVTATSPSSALAVTGQVITADGVPAVWTVRSQSPWIRVVRESGITGRDDVQLEVDQSVLANFDWTNTVGDLSIQIDRPGTTATAMQVGIDNQIPRIRRVINGTIVGNTARLYLNGKFWPYSQTVDQLGVTGAKLIKQTLIWDSRFAGNEGVLALDLADVTPGVPVKVRIDATLSPTEITVQTRATPVVPSGYLSLPFGMRRAPHFGASSNSLYFAGQGMVYRWTHDGRNWNLVHSKKVDGLIDVALTADETRLFAISENAVIELDPIALTQLSTGRFPAANSSFPDNRFATNAWAGLNAFSTTADGRTFASLIGTYPDSGSRGVGWITGKQYWNADNLTDNPVETDPGPSTRYFGANPAFDSGIIRSPNHQTLIAIQPNGSMRLYQSSTLQWSDFYQLNSDTTLAAISDDAITYIQSNGILFKQGVSQGPSVAGRLPTGYQAGGYGLSGDGKVVFVYGYKVDNSIVSPSATDAAVWAIDIHDLTATPLAQAPIIATVALEHPLGCLAPSTSGETCSHTVTITTAQGSRSLFLSGPRGMAALSLPVTSPATVSSLGIRAHAMGATALRRNWSTDIWISRQKH